MEEVREGEQTDLPVKLHPLLNFAETQPGWLKSWSPGGSACSGAHLCFPQHNGCPFGVVTQESPWLSTGRAQTDT